MLLTPTELERLTIYTAAELARKRRAKGLKLNYPEAIALICDEILEGAREGRSRRRPDRLRLDDPDHRRRDAWRRRDDAHAPGRGRLSRRHQAGHGPRADPARRRAGRGRSRRRARSVPRTATSSSTPAGRRPALTVRQHRRPAGADRQPFPLLRGQQGARLRSRRSLRHAARHSGRHRSPLRAGADQGGDAGAPSAARRDLRAERADQRIRARRCRQARRRSPAPAPRGFKGA